MSKYLKMMKWLAANDALTPEAAEKLMAGHSTEDGGPGSGNFGHAGRPGKRGGSGKGGGGTAASGPSSGGESSSGTMKEPYGGFGGQVHGSLKRNAKASEKMLGDFKKKMVASPTAESAEAFLNEMKPGQAFRWQEQGRKKNYDWAIKNADGTFTFTSREDGSQTKLSAKELAGDLAMSGDKMPDVLGDFSVPVSGASDNDAYWSARRHFADLEPNPGDRYTGTRYSLAEGIKNAKGRTSVNDFPEEKGNASKEYTQVQRDADGRVISAGVPAGKLDKGTGVTNIDPGDIMKPNPDDRVYNTLSEHSVRTPDGRLVLTPEREKLHQEIISDIFKNAQKPADGKKVFTMLGGGSAAGKGTIQGKESGVDFPGAEISPVLDADKIKESLPEYADTAFTDNHENAASYAHEESSALVKRAMQTAMANGYSFTLDGTGDGSLPSMKKKIADAQKNGYTVNGVYVTCPTELAVERSIGRSKTDKYGRLVKPETVRDIHAKVSKIFPEVAPLMDHVDLYDTAQGGKPVKIAECNKGGPIKILNKELYQAFLNKAKEIESK